MVKVHDSVVFFRKNTKHINKETIGVIAKVDHNNIVYVTCLPLCKTIRLPLSAFKQKDQKGRWMFVR